MNILMLNYEYPPIGGGGANANYYLLQELAKDPDITLDLVTSSTGDNTVYKESARVTIHRLFVGKNSRHYWTLTETINYLIQADQYLDGLLARRNYDLVWAFFGFPSGYLAYRLRATLPYLVSLRGSDVPGFNERLKWHYLLLKPLFRRIWQQAQQVVTNSCGLTELAQKTTPKLNFCSIPNGVSTTEFSPTERVQTSAVPKLLTVCRLIGRKRVQDILMALEQLAKKNLHPQLTIVGEGREEAALKKLALKLGLNEQINFLGLVEHQLLPKVYQSADIFVMPSEHEGMSNAVLEAMASGLPLIICDTGGTKELVTDNGLTVPAGDTAALARAITKLIGAPDLCREMGQRSRARALKFSWENTWKSYKQLLVTAAKPAGNERGL